MKRQVRFCFQMLLSLLSLSVALVPPALAQTPKTTPQGPPDIMYLCTDHCVILTFNDGYFVALLGGTEPESKYYVTAWESKFISLTGVSLAKDFAGAHQITIVSGVPTQDGPGVLNGRYQLITGKKVEDHDFKLTWEESDLNGNAAAKLHGPLTEDHPYGNALSAVEQVPPQR